jgi:hypothetical protein
MGLSFFRSFFGSALIGLAILFDRTTPVPFLFKVNDFIGGNTEWETGQAFSKLISEAN